MRSITFTETGFEMAQTPRSAASPGRQAGQPPTARTGRGFASPRGRGLPFALCGTVLALCFLATGASAGNVPEGCFARAYSDDHMAKVPEQSVVQMLALVEPYPTELTEAQIFLKVLFREGGQGAVNVVPGTWYKQVLFCWDGPRDKAAPLAGWVTPDALTCYAECDGGMMQIARWDGSKLDLRTSGLFVDEDGGECEGNAFLAPEGQEAVTFRLHPVDLNFCVSQ